MCRGKNFKLSEKKKRRMSISRPGGDFVASGENVKKGALNIT
jgi:hypothetical protein